MTSAEKKSRLFSKISQKQHDFFKTGAVDLKLIASEISKIITEEIKEASINVVGNAENIMIDAKIEDNGYLMFIIYRITPKGFSVSLKFETS